MNELVDPSKFFWRAGLLFDLEAWATVRPSSIDIGFKWVRDLTLISPIKPDTIVLCGMERSF